MTAYFSTSRAAEHMNVSVDTIRDAIKSGRLVAKRLSESPQAPYLMTEEALDAWFEELADA